MSRWFGFFLEGGVRDRVRLVAETLRCLRDATAGLLVGGGRCAREGCTILGQAMDGYGCMSQFVDGWNARFSAGIARGRDLPPPMGPQRSRPFGGM